MVEQETPGPTYVYHYVGCGRSSPGAPAKVRGVAAPRVCSGTQRLWGIDGDRDGIDPSGERESRIWEAHPADGPEWGIITTQTCDLEEQGTPVQPWFAVSPVYQLADNPEAAKLAGKQYVVRLSNPALNGTWIADLRIEVPVEKSFLAGKAPVAGFSDGKAAEEFGIRLGRPRARSAFANELSNEVIRKITRKRANNRARSAQCSPPFMPCASTSKTGTTFARSPCGST